MEESEVVEGWDQFLAYTKKQCSSTAYQNWLAPIHLKEVTSTGVVLEIPNIFVKDYLLSNPPKDHLYLHDPNPHMYHTMQSMAHILAKDYRHRQYHR